MYTDPILDEVWRARDELLQRFNGDLDALVRHLQEQQEKSRHRGFRVVKRQPRPLNSDSAEPA